MKISQLKDWIVAQKGIWARALFCLVMGLAFIFLDDSKQFDLRLQLRGPQSISENIVLLQIGQSEWSHTIGRMENLIQPAKEYAPLTDSYFWDKQAWERLLGLVLKDHPLAIGVTFYFSQDLERSAIADHSPLRDERIVWAAKRDNEDRVLLPLMANAYGFNTGVIDFNADEDRVVRRTVNRLSHPHLAYKIAEKAESYKQVESAPSAFESQLINFRGRAGRFPSVTLSEVLDGRAPKDFFRNKLVIVGSSSGDSNTWLTPVGEMSRTELVANIVDNISENRWVRPLGRWVVVGFMILCLLASVFFLTSYPQSVAFIFLIWIGMTISALSIWTFDRFYIWIPLFAPLVLLFTTYVVFLGFQLSRKENLTWRLEQEKKYLFEVEQLKNNFLSLISHDLKTPIAKIQAICDRLMARPLDGEVEEGLKNLRRESSELHRYIQTLLQITRAESGNFHINKEATDVNELIKKVYEQVLPLAKYKGIELTLNLEPLFAIEVDAILIQEVILNLVENAIKYTPEKGRVRVTSEELDDQVIVAVIDSGGGISEQDKKRVFEKFFRGEKRERQTQGSGLGLFLVKYFVELHGGSVFLNSEPTIGTRVGFSLPLRDAAAGVSSEIA